MSGVWREWRDRDWPSDLHGDVVMDANVTDRFFAKQGRTIARWQLPGGPSVYIKRHYRASMLRGLFARMGLAQSDALQEAEHLRWAKDHGFQVPRVVAFGERRGPGNELLGYLAVEELNGMIGLHEAIPQAAQRMSRNEFMVWKKKLCHALGRLIQRLHGMSHFHKDLYLCHFYIPETLTNRSPASWEGQIVMIDLHRLGKHPWFAQWWRLKDLAQLLYSADLSVITDRDRLTFWREYVGKRKRQSNWLRRAILVRYRNYRRHNQTRANLRKAA